ncbi:MAG TPA: Type 1 glutamine amidotransferase-like domain-containing protein [Thermoanaerobaculia bacterium]|jgi:cyanophycinase-like exopeptidase|nr:Type 1 glutamine amidotransferase-like domain-containing protein [Thermoanaerobaculia bacterium]
MNQPLTVETVVPVTLLVLIGGGEFSFGETREIDEFLLAQMPRDRRTIAFLPTASGSAEYAQHLGKYFQEIDPTVETVNVPIYRGRDNRRPKNLNAILGAGMIYIGGGVTNTLLGTLRESAAEIALRQAASNGAVIAAIGAAASSFGTRVRDMRGVTTAIDGMGWLPNTVIEAGFDDTALRRLMSLPDIRLGVGVPASTALAIRADGSTQVFGEGQIAAYRKGA